MKTKLMSVFVVLTLACLLVPQKGEAAKAPPEVALEQLESMSAEVIEIDKKDRQLVLMDKSGDMFSLEVTDQVRNFDQIKVGDMVNLDYYDSVAIYLGKRGAQPQEDAAMVVARAKKGEMPGGFAIGAIDASAKVIKINRWTRKVTFEGPNGKKFHTRVDKKVKAFDNLKEGDTIHVRYTEAIAISVTRS